MLRAVCFDLMGTLLYDPYREAVLAATGMGLEELAGLKDPGCWPAFELGEIDEAEFARRFFPAPGPAFDLAAFNRARREGYRFLPGTREILSALRGTVALHVASNYPVWIEELRLRFDLDHYFDGVWASHHLGARKPDPLFYERLVDKVGHPPDQCLFVDDRQDNCGAAAAAGFGAHRFTTAEDLAHRLAAEGLRVDPERQERHTPGT